MEGIDVNKREMYVIKRKRKKIRLKQLAEHIGCSVALLSMYETGKHSSMCLRKIKLYQNFIDQN